MSDQRPSEKMIIANENPQNQSQEDRKRSIDSGVFKVETLSSAELISRDEMRDLQCKLVELGSNQLRLEELEKQKDSFLFSCQNLLDLMNITESVKTRLGYKRFHLHARRHFYCSSLFPFPLIPLSLLLCHL